MDSDQFTVAAKFNIEALHTVDSSTYDQIVELVTTNTPLTKARQEYGKPSSYIVFRISKNANSGPNRTRLASSSTLPRPLADLVYALGRWQSHTNGVVYDIRAPTKPDENAPLWWTVGPTLIGHWQKFLARTQKYYPNADMPRRYENEGQPLVIVAIHEENNFVQANSLTNESQLSDAIIRCVNESAMFENSGIHVESNHLTMTTRYSLPT